jgi:hypothetical protein
MTMLQNRASPNLPQAPAEYDVAYMNAFSNVIRLFFNNINAVQQLNLASLNLDLKTLPTDADYDNLRLGDVYRDTQSGTLQTGTNILRIKVPIVLLGVQGAGAVGSVGPVGGTITKSLTGVSGAGAVGSVGRTITLDLTGVSGAGAVGTVTP